MCIVYKHNKNNVVCYTDFACWFNSLQMWLVQVVIFLGTLSDLHYTHKYHMNTHVFKQYLLCMFIAFCTRSVFVGIFLKDDR